MRFAVSAPIIVHCVGKSSLYLAMESLICRELLCKEILANRKS